jgi:hypothetical protein
MPTSFIPDDLFHRSRGFAATSARSLWRVAWTLPVQHDWATSLKESAEICEICGYFLFSIGLPSRYLR